MPPSVWLDSELKAKGVSSPIIDTSDLQKDLGLDSLDLVELIMSAETFYNIQIPDNHITHLFTCGNCVQYLNRVISPILIFELKKHE